MPWYMAQARKIWVTNITLGLLWTEAYMTTFTNVLWPGRDK
jgi:hypothetical protein